MLSQRCFKLGSRNITTLQGLPFTKYDNIKMTKLPFYKSYIFTNKKQVELKVLKMIIRSNPLFSRSIGISDLKCWLNVKTCMHHFIFKIHALFKVHQCQRNQKCHNIQIRYLPPYFFEETIWRRRNQTTSEELNGKNVPAITITTRYFFENFVWASQHVRQGRYCYTITQQYLSAVGTTTK